MMQQCHSPRRRRALPFLLLLLLAATTTTGLGADTPRGSTNAPLPETKDILAHLQPNPATRSSNTTHVILLVGAPGEAEFGSNFVQQAQLWRHVAQSGGARLTTLGLDAAADSTNDLAQLHALLDSEPTDSPDELWLVLVGHGTFDGREARFNLRGPDLAATDLATRLKPFRRPLAIINTSASSAPFLNKLSASNRVVITATRSGYEQNFTRFGRFLAEALADPKGDLDQDGQTSLLEAFLGASFRVAEFYKTEGRMTTEHALLDDNGDSLGTPADWFRGLRAVKKSKDSTALDGARAHQFHLVRSIEEARLSPEQRAHRDDLERRVADLRESRNALGDDAYFAQLEPLLRELARLYHHRQP